MDIENMTLGELKEDCKKILENKDLQRIISPILTNPTGFSDNMDDKKYSQRCKENMNYFVRYLI